MREPSARRESREIVVPGDMRGDGRGNKPASGAPGRRRAPRRGEAAPGEFRAALAGAARWLGHACLHRPAETAGSAIMLGAAIYVSVNALGLQTGRHPAPILPAPKMEAARPATKAEPKPAPKLAEKSAEKPAPEPARERAEAAKPAPRDPIGEAIRAAGETTASVTPRADAKASAKADAKTDMKADMKADPAVMRAQKALSKLGYGPLTADGIMGPGTRAAIERFERALKLPVKGEAAGRTLRELSARAG